MEKCVGFFTKNEKKCELDFVDTEVQKMLSDEKIVIFEKEKEALLSSDLEIKLKTLFAIKDREMFYWEEFKRTYPVGMFAVSPDRKFLEWHSTFSSLVGWSDSELKNVSGAGKVLWPSEPSKCQVCAIVKEYDMTKKVAGYGYANVEDKKGVIIPVFVYVIPVFIHNTLDRTFVIIRDRREEITQRKEFLAQESAPIIQRL